MIDWFLRISSTLSSFERTISQINKSGNYGEKVTPVPIPNTEVKLLSADGSWGFAPVRVGRCQALPLWGYYFANFSFWPLGQAVKTPPFHGGNTGSNPVGVTKVLSQYRK